VGAIRDRTQLGDWGSRVNDIYHYFAHHPMCSAPIPEPPMTQTSKLKYGLAKAPAASRALSNATVPRWRALMRRRMTALVVVVVVVFLSSALEAALGFKVWPGEHEKAH
jgi:hypothetical protein